MSTTVAQEAELETLYAAPVEAALIKELDHLADAYRPFVELSPFWVMATAGPEGLDCTPRGDPPGSVRVVDARTLAIPDRRGNNRLDSLRNLTHDPRIALLFFVPGENRTLRINGRATISTDEALRRSFTVRGDKVPATVLLVAIERVYPQCPKALIRSNLWTAAQDTDRPTIPSFGQMLQSLRPSFDGEAYDAAYPARLRETIY